MGKGMKEIFLHILNIQNKIQESLAAPEQLQRLHSPRIGEDGQKPNLCFQSGRSRAKMCHSAFMDDQIVLQKISLGASYPILHLQMLLQVPSIIQQKPKHELEGCA